MIRKPEDLLQRSRSLRWSHDVIVEPGPCTSKPMCELTHGGPMPRSHCLARPPVLSHQIVRVSAVGCAADHPLRWVTYAPNCDDGISNLSTQLRGPVPSR